MQGPRTDVALRAALLKVGTGSRVPTAPQVARSREWATCRPLGLTTLLSALMTTTMPNQQKTIRALRAALPSVFTSTCEHLVPWY